MAYSEKTSEYGPKSRQIKEDIKTGNFRHCYLLYGSEAYLRNQLRDELKKALTGGADSMNVQSYTGKDINPAEVIDFAETMPFFADRRVIVMEDSGFFQNGCAELADYIKSPADTAYFLFVETAVDKRTTFFKAVNKTGLSIECDTPDENTLLRWIAGRLKAGNFRITAAAARHFLDRVGTDMSNIVNELDKLTSYAMGRDQITEEDIDAVCANWITSQIFVMTDAIVEKNQKKVMDLYYDLLALKEPPQKIQALIFRQFNLMLQVKELAESGRSSRDIGPEVGLSPYIAGKYMTWARGFSMDQLKSYLELCVSNDEAAKTGKLDDVISLEMILIMCSSKE
jgi:DNA polymerase-3 subunit delta